MSDLGTHRILPRPGKNDPSFIPLLIVLNVFVFSLWTFSMKRPGLFEFMADHFLVSWNSVSQGRPWTLLSAEFSHNWFLHLFLNMLVLYSFGPVVELVLGRVKFLRFYLIAGTVASLAHVLVSLLLMGNPEIPSLGASGAISGVVLLFSLLFPKQKILLFGLVPLPAIWGALLFIGLDLWGLGAQAEGGGLPIGHGAHLGGALTGFVYFLYLKKKRGLT